jgi:hypothetical protein
MLDTLGYKYTNSICIILISFPPKQWLHERVSMLRNTYIASQNTENNFPLCGCDTLLFYILYVVTF